MKRAWTRAVVDEFLTEEVVTIAKGELVDRGFVRSSVVATLENAPDAKTLRVAVDPGPHADARRVVFRGNQRIPSVKLFEVIADPGAHTRRVARACPSPRCADRLLSPRRVPERVGHDGRDCDRRRWGDAGHRRGRGRTVSTARHPCRRRAGVVCGRHQESVRALQRRDLLGSGDRSSASGHHRQLPRAGIQQRLASRLRTEAVAGQPEVDLAIAVDEGPQQRVRDIAIAGLVRTNPELVRRALKLEAGEPVNLAEWATARQRLYETGVFRSVDIQPEPMPIAAEANVATPAAPPEQPIRAKVTLAEWPRFGSGTGSRSTIS